MRYGGVIVAGILLVACGGAGSRTSRPPAESPVTVGASAPATSASPNDTTPSGDAAPLTTVDDPTVALESELADLDQILADLDRALIELAEGFTNDEGAIAR